MGLFDDLAGLLNTGGGEGQSADIVGSLLQGGGAGAGGMSGVLATLASNGLAEQVASWAGSGQNLPISPEQLQAALGSDQVQQMAQASGLPVGDFLKHLSDHLPAAAAGSASS